MFRYSEDIMGIVLVLRVWFDRWFDNRLFEFRLWDYLRFMY